MLPGLTDSDDGFSSVPTVTSGDEKYGLPARIRPRLTAYHASDTAASTDADDDKPAVAVRLPPMTADSVDG